MNLWQQIGLLVVLSCFLFWKQRRRVQTRRRAVLARLTGHGFEATELKARLGDLREHPQKFSGLRCPRSTSREVFATAVRQSLLNLAFFRTPTRPETPVAEHDSQNRAA